MIKQIKLLSKKNWKNKLIVFFIFIVFCPEGYTSYLEGSPFVNSYDMGAAYDEAVKAYREEVSSYMPELSGGNGFGSQTDQHKNIFKKLIDFGLKALAIGANPLSLLVGVRVEVVNGNFNTSMDLPSVVKRTIGSLGDETLREDRRIQDINQLGMAGEYNRQMIEDFLEPKTDDPVVSRSLNRYIISYPHEDLALRDYYIGQNQPFLIEPLHTMRLAVTADRRGSLFTDSPDEIVSSLVGLPWQRSISADYLQKYFRVHFTEYLKDVRPVDTKFLAKPFTTGSGQMRQRHTLTDEKQQQVVAEYYYKAFYLKVSSEKIQENIKKVDENLRENMENLIDSSLTHMTVISFLKAQIQEIRNLSALEGGGGLTSEGVKKIKELESIEFALEQLSPWINESFKDEFNINDLNNCSNNCRSRISRAVEAGLQSIKRSYETQQGNINTCLQSLDDCNFSQIVDQSVGYPDLEEEFNEKDLASSSMGILVQNYLSEIQGRLELRDNISKQNKLLTFAALDVALTLGTFGIGSAVSLARLARHFNSMTKAMKAQQVSMVALDVALSAPFLAEAKEICAEEGVSSNDCIIAVVLSSATVAIPLPGMTRLQNRLRELLPQRNTNVFRGNNAHIRSALTKGRSVERQLKTNHGEAYSAGYAEVNQMIEVARQMRAKNIDPKVTHIPFFSNQIDGYLQKVREGILATQPNNALRVKRLQVINDLEKEAILRKDRQQVNYDWTVDFYDQLTFAASGDLREIKRDRQGQREFHSIKRVTLFPDLIFFPTVSDMGAIAFNRAGVHGIGPLGVSGRPVDADNMTMSPYSFFTHDRDHAVVITMDHEVLKYAPFRKRVLDRAESLTPERREMVEFWEFFAYHEGKNPVARRNIGNPKGLGHLLPQRFKDSNGNITASKERLEEFLQNSEKEYNKILEETVLSEKIKTEMKANNSLISKAKYVLGLLGISTTVALTYEEALDIITRYIMGEEIDPPGGLPGLPGLPGPTGVGGGGDELNPGASWTPDEGRVENADGSDDNQTECQKKSRDFKQCVQDCYSCQGSCTSNEDYRIDNNIICSEELAEIKLCEIGKKVLCAPTAVTSTLAALNKTNSAISYCQEGQKTITCTESMARQPLCTKGEVISIANPATRWACRIYKLAQCITKIEGLPAGAGGNCHLSCARTGLYGHTEDETQSGKYPQAKECSANEGSSGVR